LRQQLAEASLQLKALPKLEQDLAGARAAVDAERTARVKAEQAAAVASATLAGTVERLEEEKARLVKVEGELTKAIERERSIAAQLTSARIAVETANAHLADAERSNTNQKEQIAELRERERVALATIAELRAQVDKK
jgi:hypothetical protein